MILLSLIAPLRHPVKDQLCLIRALATGGRIPGTNLILMPAIEGKPRFGIMEHLMMALAGGWLLFRVIFCELADEDKQCKTQNITEMETISMITAEEEVQKEEHKQKDEEEEEEELYYWEGRQRFGHEPLIKFTRQQLDILLRLNSNDDDDEDQSDYIDITDEDYSSDYPSTSAQQDDEESRHRESKSNDEEIDLMQ
ncbi:glutamic acid-rich protein-like [Drosophila innubila]|uniref:glutamic acid-rich protein-like n=1 Tax=Drosophila innubila TaxID=198719 RepID=UPI00148C0D55|nr:glutamic acid-rich protein-like [Drosophila innubila]